MDLLIRKLNCNQKISGFALGKVNIITIGYADDIVVISSKDSLQNVFSEYTKFSNASGLYLNADKTELISLNQQDNTFRVAYDGFDFEIPTKSSVVITGMLASFNSNNSYNYNVIRRINMMKELCRKWSNRYITLNSRMMIYKTFILSQLTFAIQSQEIKLREQKLIEKLCLRQENTQKIQNSR